MQNVFPRLEGWVLNPGPLNFYQYTTPSQKPITIGLWFFIPRKFVLRRSNIGNIINQKLIGCIILPFYQNHIRVCTKLLYHHSLILQRCRCQHFFPRTLRLPADCFPLSYYLIDFKFICNRLSLSIGSLQSSFLCEFFIFFVTRCLIQAIQRCV